MTKGLVAKASVTVDAPAETVWDALVNPKTIKRYMFGTDVISGWREGDPIVWKGTWQGNAYEDKGTIVKSEPGSLIKYTHYSPLSGLPDVPENYHTVAVRLTPGASRTEVTLTQDNNPTEEARNHSEKNWGVMLMKLKEFVETRER